MLETLTIDPRIRCREVKDLLTVPRVVRVQGFNEEAVKSFSTAFSAAHQTGQPVIPVVIDSYGGDPYSLFAMVDVMKCAKLPVATIIEGKAMSAGAALFACGNKGYRFIGPRACLMIHDVADGGRSKKVEDLKSDVKENDRINRMMLALLDEAMGQKVGYTWGKIQARARTDWYSSPEMAVKKGIADKIGVPVFSTKVEVRMDFELT